MKSLRHRLPTTNSLMVFEAAGRTESFTQAAKELHVSQAAISKQIRYLEEYLGHTLFERNGRRVALTPAGKQLHQKVNASFNYLADAVEEMVGTDVKSTVTISANTAMSHYWLSEAINDFNNKYQDVRINVRVITSDSSEDLFTHDVNIAIAYEPGPKEDWQMTVLFPEELFPVASPDYLKTHPFDVENPENLLQHKLLDFERIEPNWINWKVWFEAQDLDATQVEISSRFNNYIMLIDAAKRGQGVTLGTRYLLDQKLKQGQLIGLPEISVKSGRNYWLALNNNKQVSDDILSLYNFLQSHQVQGVL